MGFKDIHLDRSREDGEPLNQEEIIGEFQTVFDQLNVVNRYSLNARSAIVEDREMIGDPFLKRGESNEATPQDDQEHIDWHTSNEATRYDRLQDDDWPGVKR